MAAQGTWQGHKIEISTDLSPKYLFLASENLVKVDSKEVVRFGGFSLNYHIVGTFDHQGETTQIQVEQKAGFFLPKYLIKINEEVVMKGYSGIESIGLIRFYFGSIGFAYISSLIYLVLPIRIYFFRDYDPYWFVATKIINAIFGAFFLYFAISLKSLLIKSLSLLTTVLYIQIGLMIAITLVLFFNLMQKAVTPSSLDWRNHLGLPLLYIWFFGYLLISCKRLSQELRSQQFSEDRQNARGSGPRSR